MHKNIHTYIHTYILTYAHTCMHKHTQTLVKAEPSTDVDRKVERANANTGEEGEERTTSRSAGGGSEKRGGEQAGGAATKQQRGEQQEAGTAAAAAAAAALKPETKVSGRVLSAPPTTRLHALLAERSSSVHSVREYVSYIHFKQT